MVAKAGIIALTKSAAYDLAKFDIQVNCSPHFQG